MKDQDNSKTLLVRKDSSELDAELGCLAIPAKKLVNLTYFGNIQD